MSRLSAHGTVVASTTVSAVLALCMIGFGVTAPAAASSLASSTTSGDDTATSVDIAAAIGASLDAGSQAGARTGGGFTRSFATSATAVSAAESGSASQVVDTGSALSPLAANSVFAAAASALTPTVAGTSFAASTFGAPTVTDPSATGLTIAEPGAGALNLTEPSGTVANVIVPPLASVVAPSIVAVAAPARVRVVAPAPALPVGSPRQVAQSLAANAGWTGAQWTCLSSLWQRESLFRTTARNYRSGAYGIPQALPASKMATAGADWRTNPATQVRWGLHYIASRYGNPCNAWSHWKRYRSY